MSSQIIQLKAPYSFERLLRRLETHPDPQIKVVFEQKSLQRVFRVNNRPILASIRFTGELDHPSLSWETSAALSAAEAAGLEKHIRHMFSADVDLAPLYALMQADAKLAPLAERFRGLRFVLDDDLFQSMVKTIIGQQINLAFAATLTERLLELAGESVQDAEGTLHYAFPAADRIAVMEPEALRPLQFSQRKAEYIIDLARAVVNGRVDLEGLWKMDEQEIMATLTPLRGIGKWTVECMMMFGMGRPDLLPVADIGLKNGMQLVYQLEARPDEAEMRRIGESWAPWRSYVSLYVWETVGALKRKEAW
ncbi:MULTISPECIES: DNA-3-methyladenine glycosylase 2 [Brevibacillus]|uniref:DNA-3-methyladenine glycosylase 2 n=1 Tax=Brevibacillus TaxID=55080 RepID=UPI0004F2EC5E|nr:DNA-3-methyladenine glycosylase [Brevibacillus borstelensis]KKX56273.1 DNA-3-methyladenine glycosylase [Brevibacillus borstelensis cifa_chp40]MBE5395516.1 DNA-3-methyladenine glycosylase 2 family protein [Brevibacillus borstelensis]MCM3622202.1 DNA-3-methyladenine glycosylase [Brevibacillus borstelensis]MED1744581.1 DNA-3-methyladenine glycosylase [Brevibacillus borstelensis]MED1885470.1 DNA-3-methyladenine glycosylase [Brevibacillus borstelensis]